MPPELEFTAMTGDILKKGNLRKAKNWNKRFFVLRDGSPAKLEYYESEKKWKNTSSKPKRRFNLERPWNISKKKDAKHEFLIVIFTEEEYLSMAAENAEIQEQWICALEKAIKPEPGFCLFNYMWHVTVENKEMVGGKNSSITSLHGAHRVCLTHDQMVFVPATNTGSTDYSRGMPIEIPITKIRVCGHKEGMFFIQPGRSSGIGHGNLWLDLGDEVMAANMHQTILKVMYALNQEEANGIRGRSYSSGSNAGRTRSVRSHHNNPPPSQVGMGKVSNNRMRCDSLPVTNLGGANDSRLRTGSEGEHTMKKPPRFSNMRSGSGSASPGMRRQKMMVNHSKRNNYGHHQQSQHLQNVCHTHSASLSGSFNGSSPTSSMECLSINSNSTEPFPLSSSGCYSSSSRLTPQLSSLSNASDGTLTSNVVNKETVLCDSAEMQENQLPLQVISRSYERHYCTICFAHIPYYDPRNETAYSFFSSLAPSPPDIEPPHPNFGASTSSAPEYVNIGVHSRAQSADENMSTDTAFSSLSASPQATFSLNTSQPPGSKICSESASGKTSSATNTSDTPLDEYISMESNKNVGKYPHQKISGAFQKQNSSILSKFASMTGVSTLESRKKTNNATEVDYTPMIPTTTTTTTSKPAAAPTNDYVPMRSFVAKHSNPQDISYRRRSIPDGYHRHSAGSSLRGSSPPYDFSPADKFYDAGSPIQSLCLDCQRRLMSQKGSKADDMQYTVVIPGSARSDSSFPPSLSSKDNFEKTPLVHVTPSEDTAVTLSGKKVNKTISLQSLQSDIEQNNSYATNENNSSNFSSSPVDSSEINGYLPMTPLNGQNNRSKTVVSNILSVAENNSSSSALVPPQYPHQKRGQPDSYTNSLDRPRRSPRNKRPKPFGSRNFSNGSTRRSQSLRQPSKSSNEALEEARNIVASKPTKTTMSSLTPSQSPAVTAGGEYVNIDYAKAQEQLKLNSPHLVHSDNENEPAPSALTPPPTEDDSEYTEMIFNPMSCNNSLLESNVDSKN